MPSHNQSAPYIKGFTLIELVVVLALCTILTTLSLGVSIGQYNQWLSFSKRETALDTFIQTRSPTISTSTKTINFSVATFSAPITLYENGELQY